jgi:hypothetical protein
MGCSWFHLFLDSLSNFIRANAIDKPRLNPPARLASPVDGRTVLLAGYRLMRSQVSRQTLRTIETVQV